MIADKSDTLEHFIRNLPGHVKVIVDDTSEEPKTEYVYEGRDVIALICIPECRGGTGQYRRRRDFNGRRRR
jgi:hypothetical protein